MRYEPDYFEKKGFKPFRRKEAHAISVGELDKQIDQFLDDSKAERRGVKYMLA